MSKATLKYIVAALLFVDLCSIAVIGLLLAFVIPFGAGPFGAKFFLGLHRHEWADIHLTLSVILLGLVILHVWLSWDWVVGITKKFFGDQWQRALWVLCGAWFAVIFAAWIIVKLG
ncbi:MAG: DUF4405 domain-containing protein [Deltaproteobacteria bacterium]|jgi:hypothetical protein|nr:DUF4405 domain-containing protein [Deltaproteobacteria bacterium]